MGVQLGLWGFNSAARSSGLVRGGCGCGAGTSGVVGVHPAGDGACFFYDGHSHPFLRLRDGTHRWPVRPVNPASSPGQADQAGTAGRCHINHWARPTERLAGQPGRRWPNRRSGRDPASRPYAPVQSRSGKPGRKYYPHSPCRLGTPLMTVSLARSSGQICRLWVVRIDAQLLGSPNCLSRSIAALTCVRKRVVSPIFVGERLADHMRERL